MLPADLKELSPTPSSEKSLVSGHVNSVNRAGQSGHLF
jgi:hypothetical protein